MKAQLNFIFIFVYFINSIYLIYCSLDEKMDLDSRILYSQIEELYQEKESK